MAHGNRCGPGRPWVVFEEYDGAVNGIMDIEGNYPEQGTR